jgi:hypothetical protein
MRRCTVSLSPLGSLLVQHNSLSSTYSLDTPIPALWEYPTDVHEKPPPMAVSWRETAQLSNLGECHPEHFLV